MSPRDKKAFTLIEILIVLAISVMLSSIALTYSGVARSQTALSVQTSEVAQTILFAKNLATAAYITSSSTCGYGVFFDPSAETYSVFAYTPPLVVGGCPDVSDVATSTIYFASNSDGQASETAEYSESTWDIPLANGVKFGDGSDALSVILFYPPQPTTMLSTDPIDNGFADFDGVTNATVYLQTADGSASTTIPVNLSGQVSL